MKNKIFQMFSLLNIMNNKKIMLGFILIGLMLISVVGVFGVAGATSRVATSTSGAASAEDVTFARFTGLSGNCTIKTCADDLKCVSGKCAADETKKPIARKGVTHNVAELGNIGFADFFGQPLWKVISNLQDMIKTVEAKADAAKAAAGTGSGAASSDVPTPGCYINSLHIQNTNIDDNSRIPVGNTNVCPSGYKRLTVLTHTDPTISVYAPDFSINGWLNKAIYTNYCCKSLTAIPTLLLAYFHGGSGYCANYDSNELSLWVESNKELTSCKIISGLASSISYTWVPTSMTGGKGTYTNMYRLGVVKNGNLAADLLYVDLGVECTTTNGETATYTARFNYGIDNANKDFHNFC